MVLRVAIPNKGRLHEASLMLIERAGIKIENYKSRVLSAQSKDGNYTIMFLRTQDVPSFLSKGILDLGITGKDIVYESKEDVEIIKDLNFGHCKVVVAVPQCSGIETVDQIPEGARVATSFVNIAKNYFDKIGKKVEIIEISGATEISPQLGLSDLIVDITSTGSTLQVNKLKIIAEILHSESVIAANKDSLKEHKKEIEMFCMALQSVMLADEKKYLMANVPGESLEEIKNILPGLSSPTIVSLLDRKDEFAIHVVVDSDKVYQSIGELKRLGATGILILSVDQMIP